MIVRRGSRDNISAAVLAGPRFLVTCHITHCEGIQPRPVGLAASDSRSLFSEVCDASWTDLSQSGGLRSVPLPGTVAHRIGRGPPLPRLGEMERAPVPFHRWGGGAANQPVLPEHVLHPWRR